MVPAKEVKDFGQLTPGRAGTIGCWRGHGTRASPEDRTYAVGRAGIPLRALRLIASHGLRTPPVKL